MRADGGQGTLGRDEMTKRIRQVLSTLLIGEDRPMKVKDADGTEFEVGMKDVREIQQACGCSESEAMDRLAGWVVETLEGKR